MRNNAHVITMPLLVHCVLFALVLPAQPSHGYVVAGLGSDDSAVTSQFVFGGEWVVGKAAGVGAELGAFSGHRNRFAFGSANGYYHFPSSRAERRLDPFVTAGIGSTLDPYERNAALLTFGGGANYWFRPRLGARLEIRDMVATNLNFGSRHFWGFRFGLSFH